MTVYTPSTGRIKEIYVRCRADSTPDPGGRNTVEAFEEEIERYFAAHDQGVRDAVRPFHAVTGLIGAVWTASYPVQDQDTVPADTPMVIRYKDGKINIFSSGINWNLVQNLSTGREIRTLEPLLSLTGDGADQNLVPGQQFSKIS